MDGPIRRGLSRDATLASAGVKVETIRQRLSLAGSRSGTTRRLKDATRGAFVSAWIPEYLSLNLFSVPLSRA